MKEHMADEFSRATESGFASSRASIGRFNLALFGPTGVGKSTLVNTVFGVDLAQTGIGRPVTRGSHLYRHETSTMGIIDTQGLEIGRDVGAIAEDVRRLVEESRRRPDSEHVHVVWYCVGSRSNRLQSSEESVIRELRRLGLPVLLVITQTDRKDGRVHPNASELKRFIDERELPIWGGTAFLVNAQPDMWAGSEAHGLDRLLEATAAAAPARVRSALAAAQRIDKDQKRRQAQAIINAAVERVTRDGLSGDPRADWAEMFSSISTIYGLPEESARDTALESTSLVTLRKLLQVRGPATLAIGESWLETCEHFWAEAYPHAPAWNAEECAVRFADELAERLPTHIRKWQEWRGR